MPVCSTSQAHDLERLAQKLDQIAQGYAFYGEALRAAKKLPFVTADEWVVLTRYQLGVQRSTDHTALMTIAIRAREEKDKSEFRKTGD